MASTSSRPGADMQFLAIATGQMSPEEAYPTVEDTERMWRARLVKNARRHVTIVAKLGNESATCTLPQDLATGGSDEIGKQVDAAGNSRCVVTMHEYDFIVVEMMIQHILDVEYHLDHTQKLDNYKLTHLKKAQPGIEDDSITVRVDDTPTEFHLKVYLCARKMAMPVLWPIAVTHYHNSLVESQPTAEEFANMLERNKSYFESDYTKGELVHLIAGDVSADGDDGEVNDHMEHELQGSLVIETE
ncbi:uncharacterized protein J4E88_010080 [Alternaria novae-zelandiae]|uniref:uncharacterized protein n=1 Tax=Alternaria novae-zelandiae TaxID=430562 RepID=UPI0020C3B659|nr:uncharacterized protein J4E88_010080 [Alternaria novae-zelandiae]KAI4667829.1 hypothetical protein J4E88_010080 [Alternaria novae-zelandiae]